MNENKIIRMINQISQAFEAQGLEKAANATAEHVNKFWEKRMRVDLFEALESERSSFTAIALKACEKVRK